MAGRAARRYRGPGVWPGASPQGHGLARRLEGAGPMSRGGLLRRFPVLGIRDFRLLLADRLIAPMSVGFSLVGVSFAVLQATNSPADLSYVLAAQIVPSVAVVLAGGVAADTFPPQR